MKKRFTILMAAFTLLAFLAIPMGMKAAEGDVHDMNITQSTLLNNNAAIPTINIAAQSYSVKKITINWRYNKAIENPVTIEVLVGENSWGIQTITGNTTADAVFEGESTIGAIVINFTNNTGNGTGHGTFYVNSVKLTEGESSGPAPTTYTVTFDAGDGTFVGNTDFPNASNSVTAGTYTLPSATPATGYTFDGWAMGETTYQAGASYTVSGNADFVASYTENTTPTPGGTTATLNIQAYAEANNWVNGTKYATATVDPVTFTANGGSNTGKYYTSGQDWRFYQGESASITITVPEGYTLVSVTPTYSVSNGGVLKNGNATIASGTTVNVSGTSVTFTVGNSGSATNGQVRFTNIDVVYVSEGGTQTASDLTITNESTDLTFDLYNNTTAQVISYTTSSTGAITITPAESDYFSYVHDATAKTITITPTAVTPSAQTVTISQAADDDYYSGTANFTVSVVNSAPLANIAELTALTAAGSYNVALSNAVVTYVNGNYAYIQDASGAIVMYKSEHGLTAGDVLNGTATVTYQVRNGNPQITNLTGVTPVSGTAPNPTEVAASAWNYTFNNVLSQYFKITGATITLNNNKYYISLNNESIQLYKVGTAISGLDLTKTYSITGFPTLYNSTKELQIFVDPEVETATTPTVTVTPNTIDAPFAGADGALTITYENITEFISFDYYFCDADGNELEGDDPDWIYAEINDENEAYTLSYIIDANDGAARTAYMKVYTFDDNLEEVYAIVTVNQAAYESPNVTWNLSINETATATEDEMTWTSNYATMAVEKGTSSTNTNNYYPGTSGHNYTSTRFYTGSVLTIAPVAGYAITSVVFTATTENYANALENSTWTNATASAEGSTVTITPSSGSGAIQATIGATCGFTQVKVYYEQHQAETYDLTISLNENIPFIFVFDANDQTNPLIEDGAPGTVQVLEGTSILVSPDVAEGYVLETLTVNNENVISQLDESGAYTFTMPAENVTISATAVEDVPPTPGEWVMVGLNDLTEDDVFVIVGVYDEDESSFAMPNNGTSAPSTVDVTMVGNTLAGDIAENLKWNLSIGEDGYTFYPNGETESWLYCNNTNNGVRVGDNENNVFTMTPEGYLYNNATSRYVGIYNRQDWRCYNSINNNIKDQTFAFYKRVDEGSLVTYTLDIEGYQDDNNNGGYYLIASPVSMIRPTFENGFLTDAYDLYYFDQAQENEWRNYKSKHFNIAACKGYLYASKENTTLTFTGVPYQGNGEIELSYTEGGDFAGWNLVGNPYDTDVFIDRDFYVMNPETGGEIIAGENNTIAQYQGFFVIAEEDGEILRIGDDNNDNPGSKIVLNVSNARNSVIDRALIRFGEGRTLPKFMFNPNSTKLYINQNGKDFAVVRSINENSTPVSFHAAENGNYTLSINVENVEMEYLHLIDNMTGADVDLLASPSYSFEARTTDIANRFRLVYATTTDVNGNNVEPFAFFNGSEWTINNTNNGMVQVIDQLGHVVLSKNAAQRISTASMASGVYTLRLINNNEMKTQKIIVR